MSSIQQQIFEMLTESQYWPPEQMLAYQRDQLGQLLHHARAQVPFYRSRLDCVFRSNGEIDWDRWREIPIVDRRNLVNDRESMQARKLPPGHGPTYADGTSGSSGVPVSITQNFLFGWASVAASHRAYQWYGFDYALNFLDLQESSDPERDWPEGKSTGSWGPQWEQRSKSGRKYILNRATPEGEVLEFIQRNNIKYLSSWSKTIQAISLAAERTDHGLKLNAVVTRGTSVSDDEREDIIRISGAAVLEQYSSTEAFNMASSCKDKKNLHINDDLVLLEIIDDQGLPCAIGKPGRVIVTPLFRTAQPLIRYEQGDIAVRGVHCPCGKNLPTLEQVSGRMLDMFHLPGGRKILPALPVIDFTASFGAKTWQLVQVAPLAVELRFVRESKDTDYNYAKSMIEKTIDADISVSFVELDRTPLTSSGKFLRYRREMRD